MILGWRPSLFWVGGQEAIGGRHPDPTCHPISLRSALEAFCLVWAERCVEVEVRRAVVIFSSWLEEAARSCGFQRTKGAASLGVQGPSTAFSAFSFSVLFVSGPGQRALRVRGSWI